MKKIMTAEQLDLYARAFIGKTVYGQGGFCQRLTVAELDKLRARMRKHGSTWYDDKCCITGHRHETWYEYLLPFAQKGTYFVADCCGLIKGIQAGYRADGTVGNLTPDIDITIEKMVEQMTDIKTDVRQGGKGEMMFFKNYGHVMLVNEKGVNDVESAPTLGGVDIVPIGYQPLSSMGGVGKLPWVDYGDAPTPAPVKEDEVKYAEIKWVRKGDTGVEVKTVQANVGVFVDGIFGKDTEAAVKKFQKKKGLEADGIVGTNTWRAIIEGWHR